MDENLQMILQEFTTLEYELKAVESLIITLETYYDMEQKEELKVNLSVIRRVLHSLNREIDQVISRFDSYLN